MLSHADNSKIAIGNNMTTQAKNKQAFKKFGSLELLR